jgi:oligopeptidase A
MENWTWEKDALPLFSEHYQTGEPLPDALYDRMIQARRFMGGWAQMRQLSFGYADLTLHLEYDPGQDGDVLEYVRALLRDYVPNDRFARYHSTTSFTHLFAGGYAAAYYSYLWSEVLEADAFRRFEEEGIFNRTVGREYMDAILTQGDSDEPEVLFRRFMGRDPDLQPLLDRNLGPAPEPVAS